MKLRLNLLMAAWVLAAGQAGAEGIKPGSLWLDNRGRHIQAHGGGITRVGGTYYWFGEDYSPENPKDQRCVACYSSENLVDWTFRKQVVRLSDPEHLGPGWVLQRPKVFYNAATKQYVLYAHIDDGSYKFASVAVFKCDRPDGDYVYVRSFRPLNHESRDIGQFIDDDGQAYLIFEDRPFGFRIARLSRDYLDVDNEVCLVPAHLEGGAIVRYDGLYYAIGSDLTGWDPNPNRYATATSLAGPWSELKQIAPPETKTYGSQSSFLLKVSGEKSTSVLFLGDIWNPKNLADSRYLWMPMQIGGGVLKLPAPAEWSINLKTGETFPAKP
ncbi:MAG: family 43 glycosylhydrolase [Verrucomicrobiota bacterium]